MVTEAISIDVLRAALFKNLSRAVDLFRSLDENSDGYVTKAEFRKALPLLGAFPEAPEALASMDALFESIDIDSNDYWVLRSLDERYRPRVLVMEYNASLGPTERKTIAYDPAYVWDVSSYFGASLAALHNVAVERGYSLVGCDSLGVNCFFVRTDCLAGFAALIPERAFVPPGYGLFIWGRHIGFSPSARAFVHV